MPFNYQFQAGKISRALNHSTVKLTWDQSDPKKQKRLLASFNHKEVRNNKGKRKNVKGSENFDNEMNQYKDLIAGSSEESEYGSEVNDNSVDREKA